MKKKNEGHYTVEREFLGKLSAEELLGRIIQAHTTYKKEETPPCSSYQKFASQQKD